MPDERRLIISSEPTLSPEEVARRTFSTAFRGFDPGEVRKYLARVSDELGVARERQRHVEHLLAQAEAKLARPQVDEATLTSALGEEAAKILGSAREAASDVRAKAEENVERILRQAHEEAGRIRAEAETVMEARTTEANEAAAEITTAAEAEAEAMVEEARRRSRAMVQEARSVRARMLQDALRRRKVAHVQVSQLRAGRERLLDAYRLVRTTLEEVTDELQRADAAARAAAEEAGRRAAEETEIALEEVEALFAVAPEEADAASAPAVEGPVEPDGEADDSSPAADSLPPSPTELPPLDLHVPPAAPDPLTTAASTAPEPPGGPDITSPAATPAPDDTAPMRPGPLATPEPAPELAEALASGELKVVEPPSEVEGVRVIVEPNAPPEVEPQDLQIGSGEPAEPAESSVEDLFARIRAERSDTVVEAEAVVATAADVDEAQAGDADEGSAPAPEPPSGEDAADEGEIERRDALTAPAEAQLAKRLKRALQDEQNDVLDRLRVQRGKLEGDAVLAPRPEQLDRYRQAAMSLLEDAARAGASFVGTAGASADVGPVADDLAEAVVGPLRQRLEAAFSDAGSPEEVVARVSAAYREWKTQRIQRLAGDHVVAAFGLGAMAALPAGTRLRWVGNDPEGPCPDCDDNALAGETAMGEAYPTGQTHPPAHSGCRCLLVRASP